jgi:hypothetical protein
VEKNGSFGFAKGRLVCRAKPNVPFVRQVYLLFVCSITFSLSLSFRVSANGLGLGEVGEIEAQMFNKPLMLIEVRMFKFSTSAPILPNPCCVQVLFNFKYYFRLFY